MTAYIIRRLLQMPITVFGVTVLVFMMTMTLDPVERSALYMRDVPHTEGAIDAVIRRYGLDDPFHVQYWRWLTGRIDPETGDKVGGILRGDFGFSRTGRVPVKELLLTRLPVSVELAIWAGTPIIVVGVWLGVIAAKHHNKLIDQAARVFSIVGWSFPTFVFALLVLMIFYAKLEWFPPGRLSDWATRAVLAPDFHRYTYMTTFDGLLNLRFDIFVDALRHLVLPIITLCYVEWAMLLRITRSSMLEALNQDYVTTARAKGLADKTVTNRHALPNALIPVVTIAGFTVVGLIGGVVITETIFDIPGMGQAAARAAQSLDLLTVVSFTLFSAVMVIIANLVIDILYGFLDPRVRLS
ncbi:MAG: ABC transporter permease [Anaerolineae bacterium]|nr:ABC transporter permease [Anaerolineae bacterium]